MDLIGKTCLLVPGAFEPDSLPFEMVRESLELSPQGWRRGWALLAAALADYRSGRFDSAAQKLEELDAYSGGEPVRALEGRLLLAMVKRQLGDEEEARELLDGVAKEREAVFAAAEEWIDVAHARLLEAEAERLITPDESPSSDGDPVSAEPAP